MANINQVSFTDPDAVDIERIRRNQMLAMQLQNQAQQNLPGGQMVSGYHVPTSPLSHLAQALKGVNARDMMAASDREMSALGERQRERRGADFSLLADALEGRKASPGAIETDPVGGAMQMPPTEAVTPRDGLRKALPMFQDPQVQKVAVGELVRQLSGSQFNPATNIAKLNPKEFTPESWASYIQSGDTTKLRPTATPNALLSNNMQRDQLQAKIYMWQNLSPAQRADVAREVAKFNLDAQKFTFESGVQVPQLQIPPEAQGAPSPIPRAPSGPSPVGFPRETPQDKAAGTIPQLRILNAELASTQDPELRASLEREIARVSGAPAPSRPTATPQPVIPGGNADIQAAPISPKQRQALELERPQATRALTLLNNNVDISLKSIENLEKMPGLSRITGPVAGRLHSISAEGTNAESELEALKAQISGQVLQAMKDASKTGGAVGQVTEREWPRLEAFLGNLNTKQETAQFKKRLADVKQALKNIKDATNKAYTDTYGAAPASGDGWSDL